MTVLLSLLAVAALGVCMAAVYSWLFDPKVIDEEEVRVAQRQLRRRHRARGIAG